MRIIEEKHATQLLTELERIAVEEVWEWLNDPLAEFDPEDTIHLKPSESVHV